MEVEDREQTRAVTLTGAGERAFSGGHELTRTEADNDVRLAAESVKFRYVDVKMGMAPAWGLTLARMVHYLGRNRTLDFLLSPDDVDATRAIELGPVTRVVSHVDLDAEALRRAEHLALGAPLTVRALKEYTRTQYTGSFEEAQRKHVLVWSWRRMVVGGHAPAVGVGPQRLSCLVDLPLPASRRVGSHPVRPRPHLSFTDSIIASGAS